MNIVSKEGECYRKLIRGLDCYKQRRFHLSHILPTRIHLHQTHNLTTHHTRLDTHHNPSIRFTDNHLPERRVNTHNRHATHELRSEHHLHWDRIHLNPIDNLLIHFSLFSLSNTIHNIQTCQGPSTAMELIDATTQPLRPMSCCQSPHHNFSWQFT